LRRLQDIEKKKVPRDMTAIHKKFEEKKQEEIQKVEERFDALLKNGEGSKHKEEEKAPAAQEEKEEEAG
jgi:hypothetical protein